MRKNIECYLIVLIFLGLQLMATSAFAKANTLDVSTFNKSPILLSSHLGVFEDTTGALTLEDVQKEAISQRFQTNLSSQKPLNMSYTSSAYWLRLELENSSDKPIERILDVNHPLLGYIDFYFQIENQNYQMIQTGYVRPFNNRAYQSRIFAFPLVLPAHSNHTIYLRISTLNAMILPIFLWEPNDFYIKERNDYSSQAVYFGLVIAIALLNFIFAVVLKEFDYLLYVCMIIFVALAFIGNRGFGHEFLWHDLPWLSQIAPLSFGSIALVSQLFFVRRMLDTPILVPKIDYILKFFIGLQLFIPVVLLLEFQFAKFMPIVFATSASLVLIVSVIGMREKKRNAYFLFTAFSVLAIGVIGNALLVFAVIPTNFFSVHSSQIGSALELIIFTFLLIDRYQIISQEKQKTALQLLAAYDENKLLNSQVNQMQKLETISRLTSGIAHDFNNILTGMLGYNELNKFYSDDIQDEKLRADIFNNATQVEKAGYRAVDLIKKMMAYSRQGTVKTDIVIKPTIEIINEVLAMLRPGLTSVFKLELEVETDLNIKIDSIDLHQILTNLLVNARDAMKEQGGLITVSLKAKALPNHICTSCAKTLSGKFIVLSVQDHGSGISDEIIHRIFDPFFTTKVVGEGTGLGLSTVSGMVHHSKGHIFVDSKTSPPNQGTTFKLLFPQPD